MFIWLQVLRGLASSMVVCHHFVGSQIKQGIYVNDWLTKYGASGTDIFFVISGFIMMYTQFNSEHKFSFIYFLIRRLIRIAPLYWILTTFAYILSLVISSVNSSFCINNFIFSMFFLPAYDGILLMSSNAFKAYVIPMSWTLTYVWYFYLIFAFIMAFRKKVQFFLLALLIWFVISITVGAVLHPTPLILQVITSPLIFELFLGCLIAYIYLSGLELIK